MGEDRYVCYKDSVVVVAVIIIILLLYVFVSFTRGGLSFPKIFVGFVQFMS